MVYLDYAATTPILEEVLAAMVPFQRNLFGNPSSVYHAGREAKKGLEQAREQVAESIGAAPSEIVFTAGGTEADNLALKGAAVRSSSHGRHIVTTAIEHHAVLHSVEWLEGQGFEVTVVPVTGHGVVELEGFAAALRPDTILVSVMLVNNEVGSIQPLGEIAELVHRQSPHALLHTDSVQALGKIAMNVGDLGVDLAAFSAHKLGGPKGTGALFIKRGVPVEPILHGGGQERGLRSGTPNVAGIAGFGMAAQIAVSEVDQEGPRLEKLRDRLEQEISSTITGVTVNAAGAPRIPGTLNVCIEGVEGESLLLMLDRREIAASSGSACASGSLEPSHVLSAMGVSKELAVGSLRFSLGRGSVEADIENVAVELSEVVRHLRSVGR